MATNCWSTCKANKSKHTSTWQPIVGPLVSQNSQMKHPHGNKLLDRLLVKLVLKDCHVATIIGTIYK
jgi:hypothetical protein